MVQLDEFMVMVRPSASQYQFFPFLKTAHSGFRIMFMQNCTASVFFRFRFLQILTDSLIPQGRGVDSVNICVQ